MESIIQLLPDFIANQIAAGEVVQRPASIVKELMENSVDAGANSIGLIVEDGGKALIQVTDNGSGMAPLDARLCFERHATSKIRNLNDLYSISTLGFRGEAMASIAAVAQVELKTRRPSDEAGTLVRIEDGEYKAVEPCGCTGGTSIAVRNLFFNVPARRNFLKSNPVELRHISEEFIRIALSHPEIAFSFHNGKDVLYNLRAGKLANRIVELFGKRHEGNLIALEEPSDILSIRGYVGTPAVSRKMRGEQYFFANGRYIRHPYLHHALTSAYAGLLQPDTHPFYALFLTIDPGRIDINVHPTKSEIKFEDERAIYAILQTAVKKALATWHIRPSLDFDAGSAVSHTPAEAERQRIGIGQGMPIPKFGAPGGGLRSGPDDWKEFYAILQGTTPETPAAQSAEPLLGEPGQHRSILQLAGRYLVSTMKSGLMVVHQRLAHERILYEKCLGALEGAGMQSRALLFPSVIHLPLPAYQAALELESPLNKLGWTIADFGKGALMLSAIPAHLTEGAASPMLEGFLNDYAQSGSAYLSGVVHDSLARLMAKHECMPLPRPMNTDEMQALIDELFACSTPLYSPTGKPTIITIAAEELARKFGG